MPRLMDSVSLANCQVSLPIFVLFLVRDISVSCFVSAFFPSSYISCFMQDSSIWCLLSLFWFRSICEIFAPKSPTSHLFWMTKSNWRKKILLKSCSRDSTGKFLNLSSWATCFGSNPFTRPVEWRIYLKSCKLRWVTWSCRNKYCDDEESGPHQSERQLQEDRREFDTSSLANGFLIFHHRTPTDHNDPALPVSLFILWKSSIEDFLRLNIVGLTTLDRGGHWR